MSTLPLEHEFSKHLDECKVDFKQRIMDAIMELKFKDAFSLKSDFNSVGEEKERRVDEIRGETWSLEKDCYDIKSNNERQIAILGRFMENDSQWSIMWQCF